MLERFGGLWRHPDFLRLWLAMTISELGSRVTVVAWPLIAAVTLDATPQQMGFLYASLTLPMLVVSLVAGVWVDRARRKPILLWTDYGRGALLLLVPLLVGLDRLRIEHLYAIGLLTGTLSVFFTIAYQSYLPSIVDRDQLVEGNSRMAISSSAAQIVGPGVAGLLVQAITAPFAILVDALSFLLSGLLIRTIASDEAPIDRAARRSVVHEFGDGFRIVAREPVLRSIAVSSAFMALCGGIFDAVFVLYALDDLRLTPGAIGLIFAAGSVGFLIGGLVTGGVSRMLGVGTAIITGTVMMVLGQVLVPLARGPVWLAVAILIFSWFLTSLSSPLYAVNQLSLRQALVPQHLLGRTNATMRFVTLGLTPVGALVGGYLGQTIGLRETLVVASGVLLGSVPAVVFSRVRRLRVAPERPTNP